MVKSCFQIVPDLALKAEGAPSPGLLEQKAGRAWLIVMLTTCVGQAGDPASDTQLSNETWFKRRKVCARVLRGIA